MRHRAKSGLWVPVCAVLVGVLGGLVAAGCNKPAPVAEQKPKRKSFEESSGWQPSAAPAAAPASAGSVQQQANQVQQSWDQAKAATNDRDREKAANQALQQTQQMADQPSSSGH